MILYISKYNAENKLTIRANIDLLRAYYHYYESRGYKCILEA